VKPTNDSKFELAEELVGHLKALNRRMDIPQDFGYLNVKIDDTMLEGLVDDAIDDRGTFPQNPRQPAREDVKRLYQLLFPQYKGNDYSRRNSRQ
jgi:alcohol dehydrogenase class IV